VRESDSAFEEKNAQSTLDSCDVCINELGFNSVTSGPTRLLRCWPEAYSLAIVLL